MLSGIDEIIRNTPISQQNHRRRHFNQLGLGSNNNMNHELLNPIIPHLADLLSHQADQKNDN